MTSVAALPTVNELPTAANIATSSTSDSASTATSSSAAATSASSLTFASLLSPSASSLGGSIGSTAHPDRITPMAPISATAPAASAPADGSSSSFALPFDVRGLLESVRQRQLHRRIRPASSFFDAKRFSRPQTTAEATARVELNLQWFWVNYLLIAALILALTVLSQPSLLLTLLVLAGLWLVVLTREVIPIPYSPYSLTGATKLRAMYAITAVILFVFAGTTILTIVGVCGLVVLAHASLHGTPTQEERDLDDQNDSITMV